MSAVLVSGANGFIAQHIINVLLEKGYVVIGTLRSEEKAESLLKLFNHKNLRLEIVPDLAKSGVFDEVFTKYGANLEYVIHTASPCHYESTDYEKDMLLPALAGTQSILDSIKKHAPDSVKRFVLTSSFAAISNVKDAYDLSLTLDESSWNNDSWEEAQQDAKTAYYGSKAFAEKAAWEFLKENQGSVKFTLTTINPCYVFGPQLFDESVSATLNASCQRINEAVFSSIDDDVDQEFASLFIDVRDVAKAHVLALEKADLAGKRLILANHEFSTQSILDNINKNFPKLNGRIARGKPGYIASSRNIAIVDNTKSKELLGFEFGSFENAVNDTVTQILRVRPLH